ncbi:hypothetical protein B0T24DRAFT_231987 [Lasiosphaeria ovina]|uniref:RING-type E3 ubiquitin transferase n=1 Tax=Lasiosphaeria ovina TaxID=92902 RepID=A0AAE0KHI9_9PEZI|nr:hypothetical protein B0T24DRAFT_231987 [Lasiosphaeria ovina]
MASTNVSAPTGGGGDDSQAPHMHLDADGHRSRGRGRGGRGRGRRDGPHAPGGNAPAGNARAGRGRGRGGRAPRGGRHANDTTSDPAVEPSAEQGFEPPSEKGAASQPGKSLNFKTANEAPQDDADDEDAGVCFICANRIVHRSLAPCNHATCHICALRLRALYKSKDCPHCRTSAPFVIFTDDATKRFEEYTSEEVRISDENIGVKYTSEDIRDDTVLLLRYNCPDGDCDFAGFGWPDLHRHVRSVHHKKLCDLCTRHKMVFTHEHDMFADQELTDHMRHGDDKPGASDQTGFKGHPLCGFCGARFYDDDKLYEHCRNKHERCFLCDRRDSRKPHYYQDYNALEEHFKKDHFICPDKECQEKKFVVFASEMDLKAHQLSEHGGSFSKDVRRVDMSSFDFRQSYQQERRGGGASGRDQNRRRGPDPNTEALPVSSAQQLRRDELAFQRQMAISSIQSAQSAQSTQSSAEPSSRPNANTSTQSSLPSLSQPPQSSQTTIDDLQNLSIADLSSLTHDQRASLTRHGAVIERAANLLGNNSTKMDMFRSLISNYNRGSMTAELLVDEFFSLFAETSSHALGTLVREAAELFDDKKKGEALRKAWHNWRAAATEDYPSLPGLGGAQSSVAPSSAWAAAAALGPTIVRGISTSNTPAAQARQTTRVLKLKNSTRRGSAGSGVSIPGLSPSSSTASSSDWITSRGNNNRSDSNNNNIIPSRSAFPALPGAAISNSTQPTWIGGTGPAITRSPPKPAAVGFSQPSYGGGGGGGGGGGRRTGVNGGGEDAFPALPAAPKPTTTIFGYGSGVVRRDFGQSRGTFNWGAAQEPPPTEDAEEAAPAPGGSKGKKKNKKQVLVQWG